MHTGGTQEFLHCRGSQGLLLKPLLHIVTLLLIHVFNISLSSEELLQVTTSNIPVRHKQLNLISKIPTLLASTAELC